MSVADTNRVLSSERSVGSACPKVHRLIWNRVSIDVTDHQKACLMLLECLVAIWSDSELIAAASAATIATRRKSFENLKTSARSTILSSFRGSTKLIVVGSKTLAPSTAQY